MQTRFRLPMLFIIGIVVLFSSCSKSNKEGRYIPKTAAFAMIINGESLSSKLPWEEVKQNDLFKSIYADSSMEAYVKAALDNPDNTGIDTKKNLLFFVQRDSTGGYVAVQGSVKDAAKFKSFTLNASKGAVETEKNGIHFITKNRMTASWDKEKFVIVTDAPEMKTGGYQYNDTNAAAGSSRDVVATAAAIYDLSEGNSLAKDEKFSELVKVTGDVHFWLNIGTLNEGNPQMAALSMLNMSKLYEDSYVTGVTSFDNGKITIDTKSYSGKEMTSLNKKYGNTKIDSDMLKRIPAKDVIGLIAFSFNPEGLREFVKLTGMEGFVNMGASSVGFSFDDFLKANKGDILISLSDLKKDSTGTMKMDALFAASVGDKNSFGKLIAAGNKLGKEKLGSSAEMLSYNVSDKFFAIGTEKLSVDKYVGSANNNSFNFIDKITGGSSAFYVNFQLLMNSIGDDMKRDSLDNIAFQETLKMWDNVVATGGGFKDAGVTQHIEVNLMDKNTNSLKQLNKYMGILFNIQEQKKKDREKWMNDAMSENDNAEEAPVESVTTE